MLYTKLGINQEQYRAFDEAPFSHRSHNPLSCVLSILDWRNRYYQWLVKKCDGNGTRNVGDRDINVIRARVNVRSAALNPEMQPLRIFESHLDEQKIV